MDPQYFAEFLERIGHTVRESNGVHWYDVFPRVYTCFPFEKQISPNSFSSSAVLGPDGLLARFSTSVDCGVSSFQHVVSDKDYGMHSLINKARNKTRRGLENCQYGRIDARDLGKPGVKLHGDTLLRQGRKLPDNFEDYWLKYFAAASACPAATAWAAWHGGELAAYLISFQVGTYENICIVKSRQEKLKHRPNNALLFSFLSESLRREDVSDVSIGLQSLQPKMASLDLFKRGMGFKERPIGQRIEFRSTLKTVVPRPMAAIAGKTLKLCGSDEKLARLSGVLSWYSSQPKINRAA